MSIRGTQENIFALGYFIIDVTEDGFSYAQ